MSQFKTQGQKIKQNIKNDMYINDITNEEFDTYYQKCQERKYLKISDHQFTKIITQLIVMILIC